MDDEATLRERIEIVEKSIEHWKRELAIETDPEYRKLFIDTSRGEQEQIVGYQERLQKLQEKTRPSR